MKNNVIIQLIPEQKKKMSEHNKQGINKRFLFLGLIRKQFKILVAPKLIDKTRNVEENQLKVKNTPLSNHKTQNHIIQRNALKDFHYQTKQYVLKVTQKKQKRKIKLK